jgi:hypothetical protein
LAVLFVPEGFILALFHLFDRSILHRSGDPQPEVAEDSAAVQVRRVG